MARDYIERWREEIATANCRLLLYMRALTIHAGPLEESLLNNAAGIY